MLHLEDVLHQLGGCGRYQVGLTSIVHYMKIIVCFSMLHMVFGAAKPDWWCIVEGVTNGNETAVLTTNSSGYKSCKIGNSSDICTNFVFDTSTVRTVVSEWNLVCGNEWMTSIITSAQMFGVLVGNVACGQVADLIGRKHPLFVSILSLIVLNLIAAFSTSWLMFAILRFLIGLAMGFELTVQYNVAAEYTLARWRTWVVSVPSWAIASSLFALASWALKDWQHLHFATAAVGIPALATYWYVPESFRWQIVHNKFAEADKSVELVAKVNGKRIPDMQSMKQLAETELMEGKLVKDKKYSLLHLVNTRKMFKVTSFLTIVWLSLGLGGYGIQFAVPSLTGNLYINMFLMSALAGPLQFVNIYLINRVGRKFTAILFLVCYSVPAFMVGLSQQFLEGSIRDTITTVCAIIALTSVNAAWSPIQTMTIEVYPTVIRNIGYGYQNTIARVGAVIGPQLLLLETKVAGILYFICGLCAIASAVAVIPLRETRAADLHDKLDPDQPSSALTSSNDDEDNL